MENRATTHRLKRLRVAVSHLLSRLGENRGAAALWGTIATLVLVLMGAAVLDVYRLSIARNWAYEVASEAALRGVGRGRDFASVLEDGRMSLDEASARQEAIWAVEAAMAERGFTSRVLDVRVLPNGGVAHGYPPVPQASQSAETIWSSPEPAVGVYLEVSVPVAFFGWVNGADSVPVHVFAAAALADVD